MLTMKAIYLKIVEGDSMHIASFTLFLDLLIFVTPFHNNDSLLKIQFFSLLQV